MYVDKKQKTKTIERLGTEEEVIKKANGQNPIAWTKKYIDELNKKEKEESLEIIQKLSPKRKFQKTCFLSLLVYRILENKLDEKFTATNIIQTLRDFNMLKIDGEGYIPAFTRTDLTDYLHDKFGFRLDTEIVTNRAIKKILNSSKK